MEFLKSEAKLLLSSGFFQTPALTCAVSGRAPTNKSPKDIIATESKTHDLSTPNHSCLFNAEYSKKKANIWIEDRYESLADKDIMMGVT